MSTEIKIKRGLKANLPILAAGEPAVTTDENELYLGGPNGNIKISSKAELSNIVSSGKLSQLIQSLSTKTTQVYLGGTSIENSTLSGVKAWLQSLAGKYGDSGNYTQIMGLLGGSYTNSYNNWVKQPFGGIQFTRLRGDATSTSLNFNCYCKRIVLRYSTESDGGTCYISADGVTVGAINCNGTQSYNNELVITFDTLASRVITINPPGSGYIYLETLDSCVDGNGLHVIDATLGGSTLSQAVNLKAPSGNQVAGIPISTNVGIDSYFGKSSSSFYPSLYIVAWCVNDAGLGMTNYDNTYVNALTRIVDQTKAIGAQLMLIIEMGGAYTMANHPNNATFLAIQKLILSFQNQPHVTVLDWHARSHSEIGIQTWAAKYYNAGTVNETNATATGDFIHPNNAGHGILSEMLCLASAIQPLGRIGDPDYSIIQRFKPAANVVNKTLSLTSPNVPIGYLCEQSNNLGIPQKYRCIGYSSYLVHENKAFQPLMLSDTEINYYPDFNNTVSASSTSDNFGKYVQASNLFMYIKSATLVAPQETTFTFVIGKGTGTIRFRNYANNTNLEQFIYGKSIGGTDFIAIDVETEAPQVVHVQTRTAGTLSLQITGKFYAIYATPTSFPCIPTREWNTAKEISGPLTVVGDIVASKLQVGQTYIETINGKTIEKICINRRVYKVNDGSFYGLYRCQNRTVTNLIRTMILGGTVTTDTYNEQLGGCPQVTNSAVPTVTIAQATNFTAGETYTLTGKNLSYNTYAFYIQSGSRCLYYNPTTQTWTETAYNSPISFTIPEEQVAITIVMPDLVTLNNVTDWSINFRQVGGNASSAKWGTWILAAGSSALI